MTTFNTCRRCASVALMLFWGYSIFAQLTIQLGSIPVNTPAGAKIYVAGSFNNWSANAAAYELKKQSDGRYALTISPAPGALEFKFTRGSWPSVEGNASGTFLPNRAFHYDGKAQTLTLSVQTWEDLGGNAGTTAAPNVVLLDDDFFIPQLNRKRKIWIYLPPDYQTSVKKYPVLYMHDAQNLFDASTSFSGEWKIDETLNDLHKKGDYGCIVVGVNNGEAKRLDEYSPWVNQKYGGGEGDEYVDFIVKTLKPYIDANFRTLPGRLSTGIMGSSMGGLISMYALSERQDVFSKAGVFSPAFWFAADNPAQHVAAHPKQGPAKVYFLAGGQEPDYVAQDAKKVADAMLGVGFTQQEIRSLTPSDGQHSEWFWAREFPAAYQWLFAGASVSAEEPAAAEKPGVYPNPASDYIRVGGLKSGEKANFKLYTPEGKICRDASVQAGDSLSLADLKAGLYVWKLRLSNSKRYQGKLTIRR